MKTNKQVVKAFFLVTQVGISMMTPIFLSTFIGYLLDKWLNTSFWIIIFLFLGIITAFRNVYHLTKSFYAKDLAKENKEQEYFSEILKNSREIQERKQKEKKQNRKDIK